MESVTNRLQSIGNSASLGPITLSPSFAITHQSRHSTDLQNTMKAHEKRQLGTLRGKRASMAQNRGPLPSSNAIAVLPVELLTIILTIVRKNTPARQYLDTLLCCRQWWGIGHKILHRDIILTSSTIATFIEKFPSECLSAIRKITISVDSRDEKLRRDLAQDPYGPWLMMVALGHFTQLHTFSFTVLGRSRANSSPYCPTQDSYIQALLKHLPQSVSNLNLDVAGYGVIFPFRKSAQKTIEEIPPQIINLRLRLGSLEVDKTLGHLNFRRKALKSLHIDVCSPNIDLESPPHSSTALTTRLDRLTSTRLDSPMQLDLATPFELQFTNYVTEYRMNMAGRATRIFASNGDEAWDCVHRILLTFNPSKPDILAPKDTEAILSAISGWNRTATGELLPGFQDDYEYELWLRRISETLSGNA